MLETGCQTDSCRQRLERLIILTLFQTVLIPFPDLREEGELLQPEWPRGPHSPSKRQQPEQALCKQFDLDSSMEHFKALSSMLGRKSDP